ncbi:alternative ribosome rescue aminoacyl-tRNA hydrolase ArfB [Streptacidiphilus carbonis]|jgi:ribosome-associated protein|uniref:alternative ribosome rescue aminoacyl-tRNA hydrolase ArfB n=1 Tax=Streptacidiphilus carbonis TaxID=105422 RepID=UPI0005A9DEF2|nr:alternative ribosome rescue aminoacyl-tRNA hydrolase ArfB [Streptacidiphilus carbonis]
MSLPVRVRGSVVVPDAELLWRFSRSGGPGGQHVNTSDTQVELRFDIAASAVLPQVWKERALERLAGRLVDDGVLVVRASEHRSQWRNREAAAVRLGALLSEAVAPPPRARRATRPSRGVVERRLTDKKRRADVKRGRSGRFD